MAGCLGLGWGWGQGKDEEIREVIIKGLGFLSEVMKMF